MKKVKTFDNKVFRIDKHRILSGLTQKELSEKSGVERTKCGMIETLTYDELEAISKVLGISKADLFCDNGRL